MAEFEVLIAQLEHHKQQPNEHRAALLAKLNDLAHAYCGSPINIGDFLMKKECYQVVKSLSSNANIPITKPDKGSGVVVLKKSDYITKMESILHDETKFKILGLVSSNDSTSRLETRLQRHLLKLHKNKLLPPNVYKTIRPIGSIHPRMYGLPIKHKKDVPLCPILTIPILM